MLGTADSGQEEEDEQLLQILQSDYITNKVIKKYDLMKHYDISPNDAYPYTKLAKEFAKNITYRPSVDYVLNQRLNLRIFYDGNITKPYTSQSFNTSFSNFGFTLRFAIQ